jgi:hypothetical protein
MIIITATLVFPKLVLGLSGFETGVTVMPFIQGSKQHPHHLPGRIRNTNKMLTSAAVIMSFFLITSSWVTILLIPASAFSNILKVKGVKVGDYRILRVKSGSVPNAIAALLLYIRDQTSKIPHAYFDWGEGSPLEYLLRFILFGEGDIPVITHEVLRKAETDPHSRPVIHIG